jgi:hypothetical protein
MWGADVGADVGGVPTDMDVYVCDAHSGVAI